MVDPLERVVVVGTSCCGKSVFSRQLAKALGCPRIELDELFWGPDWTPKSKNEFQRLTSAAAAAPRWVADGNYGRTRDLLWPRATTVIWLNYGFLTVFFRALRRTLIRNITGETLWHGNRESLARSFFSRDSILVWVATTFYRRRKEFNALRTGGKYPHVTWVEFRRPSEAAHYLRSVPMPAYPSIHSGPAQAPAADYRR
jgi:adenylate kinase family enzyme